MVIIPGSDQAGIILPKHFIDTIIVEVTRFKECPMLISTAERDPAAIAAVPEADQTIGMTPQDVVDTISGHISGSGKIPLGYIDSAKNLISGVNSIRAGLPGKNCSGLMLPDDIISAVSGNIGDCQELPIRGGSGNSLMGLAAVVNQPDADFAGIMDPQDILSFTGIHIAGTKTFPGSVLDLIINLILAERAISLTRNKGECPVFFIKHGNITDSVCVEITSCIVVIPEDCFNSFGHVGHFGFIGRSDLEGELGVRQFCQFCFRNDNGQAVSLGNFFSVDIVSTCGIGVAAEASGNFRSDGEVVSAFLLSNGRDRSTHLGISHRIQRNFIVPVSNGVNISVDEESVVNDRIFVDRKTAEGSFAVNQSDTFIGIGQIDTAETQSSFNSEAGCAGNGVVLHGNIAVSSDVSGNGDGCIIRECNITVQRNVSGNSSLDGACSLDGES